MAEAWCVLRGSDEAQCLGGPLPVLTCAARTSSDELDQWPSIARALHWDIANCNQRHH